MEDNKKNIITPVIPNDLKNTVFKTYTGDIAEVIEHDTQGLVKKIIHGEEIHEKEKKNYSPLSRKNKIFTLIGVVLFLVAILILLFLFFKRNQPRSCFGVEYH